MVDQFSDSENISNAEFIQRITSVIDKSKARIQSLESGLYDPVAIVGAACRLPGNCHSVEDFWSLLKNQKSGIVTMPAYRWSEQELAGLLPEQRKRLLEARGGFLGEVSDFDPAPFNISPREASAIDPQQRFFLMCALEAFEDASIDTALLQGSNTGVYAASISNDYLQLQYNDPNAIDMFTIVGGQPAIIANRISYAFDFQGPSVTLDTACSSSLVALHQACNALHLGECDLTLVGGVNLVLSPSAMAAHQAGLPMAADGLCKTFDASADGYVRGEGCVTLVCKRLSDALSDGDRIRAVIKGSAVNQDGRTNGISAPSSHAQKKVIKQALKKANLEARDIDYIETHGTGTSLGDPIEVEAIASCYVDGVERNNACYLGALKTNIGHLEATAGLASVLKVALATEKNYLPANLNFSTPNPLLPLNDGQLEVLSQPVDWTTLSSDVPRGAVSSFGVGGTNAHIIIEQAPKVSSSQLKISENDIRSEYYPLILSACSQPALKKSIAALAESLSDCCSDDDFACLARSSVEGRTLHSFSLSFAARSAKEAREILLSAGSSDQHAIITNVRLPDTPPSVVFVCPGQGGQWLGMAAGLLDSHPVFKQAMERCELALAGEMDIRLIEGLTGENAESHLKHIDFIQPALWSISVSLAALWQSYGIKPDYVIGHSMGEVAAAVISGALNYEQGAKIIARRSRLMRGLSKRGSMLMTGLEPTLAQEIANTSKGVDVAVINSPISTVLSGDSQTLELLSERLQKDGVFCRFVKVDIASHSWHMDEITDALRDVLPNAIDSVEPNIPMMSSLTGQFVTAGQLDVQYWIDNLRQTVQFSDATQSLCDFGANTFIELSPSPVLVSALEQTFDVLDYDCSSLGSLYRDSVDDQNFFAALVKSKALGCRVRWPNFIGVSRCHPLPHYPWELKPYWRKTSPQVAPQIALNANMLVDSNTTSSAASVKIAPSIPAVQNSVASPAQFKKPLAVAGNNSINQGYKNHYRMIEKHVVREVKKILEIPSGENLDVDQGFFSLGMDSRMTASMNTAMQNILSISIPNTIQFQHPTVKKYAKALAKRIPLPNSSNDLRSDPQNFDAVNLNSIASNSVSSSEANSDRIDVVRNHAGEDLLEKKVLFNNPTDFSSIDEEDLVDMLMQELS